MWVFFPQSSVCLTGGSSFLDSAVRMSLNLSCRSVWFTPAPLLPQSRRNWKSVFRISNMSSSGQKSKERKKNGHDLILILMLFTNISTKLDRKKKPLLLKTSLTGLAHRIQAMLWVVSCQVTKHLQKYPSRTHSSPIIVS